MVRTRSMGLRARATLIEHMCAPPERQKADMSFALPNVRFWPKADISYRTAHVRFWGQSGHCADAPSNASAT